VRGAADRIQLLFRGSQADGLLYPMGSHRHWTVRPGRRQLDRFWDCSGERMSLCDLVITLVIPNIARIHICIGVGGVFTPCFGFINLGTPQPMPSICVLLRLDRC
jgi:hypothetical protein